MLKENNPASRAAYSQVKQEANEWALLPSVILFTVCLAILLKLGSADSLPEVQYYAWSSILFDWSRVLAVVFLFSIFNILQYCAFSTRPLWWRLTVVIGLAISLTNRMGLSGWMSIETAEFYILSMTFSLLTLFSIKAVLGNVQYRRWTSADARNWYALVSRFSIIHLLIFLAGFIGLSLMLPPFFGYLNQLGSDEGLRHRFDFDHLFIPSVVLSIIWTAILSAPALLTAWCRSDRWAIAIWCLTWFTIIAATTSIFVMYIPNQIPPAFIATGISLLVLQLSTGAIHFLTGTLPFAYSSNLAIAHRKGSSSIQEIASLIKPKSWALPILSVSFAAVISLSTIHILNSRYDLATALSVMPSNAIEDAHVVAKFRNAYRRIAVSEPKAIIDCRIVVSEEGIRSIVAPLPIYQDVELRKELERFAATADASLMYRRADGLLWQRFDGNENPKISSVNESDLLQINDRKISTSDLIGMSHSVEAHLKNCEMPAEIFSPRINKNHFLSRISFIDCQLNSTALQFFSPAEVNIEFSDPNTAKRFLQEFSLYVSQGITLTVHGEKQQLQELALLLPSSVTHSIDSTADSDVLFSRLDFQKVIADASPNLATSGTISDQHGNLVAVDFTQVDQEWTPQQLATIKVAKMDRLPSNDKTTPSPTSEISLADLPNLEALCLVTFGLENESSLGNLPNLKHLAIQEFANLDYTENQWTDAKNLESIVTVFKPTSESSDDPVKFSQWMRHLENSLVNLKRLEVLSTPGSVQQFTFSSTKTTQTEVGRNHQISLQQTWQIYMEAKNRQKTNRSSESDYQ